MECFDEKEGVFDSRRLAKTKGPIISIFSTYILFLTKMQKGKPGEMSLPFIEKRYHKYFRPLIFTFSFQKSKGWVRYLLEF